jgi:hypothetical protein
VFGQIEEIYTCETKFFVVLDINEAKKYSNTIFGFYTENETLNFIDEGGFF